VPQFLGILPEFSTSQNFGGALAPPAPIPLCYHVTVTQQRPTVEGSVRKFRYLPLQAKERTWVNCKLINVWHQNS